MAGLAATPVRGACTCHDWILTNQAFREVRMSGRRSACCGGVLAAIVFLLAAANVWAASPVLNAIVPQGGRRGTEVEAVFSGQRLKDAQELLFYTPGIKLVRIVSSDENSFKAVVAI